MFDKLKQRQERLRAETAAGERPTFKEALRGARDEWQQKDAEIKPRQGLAGVKVRDSVIRYKGKTYPRAGARAELETDQMGQRISVTRMATLGIFSLAAPKKSGQGYLVVTGNGFEFAAPVQPVEMKQAREWVTTFNTAAMAESEEHGTGSS